MKSPVFISGVRYAGIIALLPVFFAAGCPVGIGTFQKACNTNEDCDDGNPCTRDACNVQQSMCLGSDCYLGVCENTPDDTLPAPDDGKPCTNDTCSGGNVRHDNKQAGEFCAQGSALRCDAMGNCALCTFANECGSSTSDSCTNPDCVQGTCTTSNKPAGTPCDAGICNDAGTCVDSCPDGMTNGTETDVDCGGGCPTKCDAGKHCSQTSDCVNGATCTIGICATCGKDSPQKCDDGTPCAVNDDCASNRCDNAVCRCGDNKMNNGETDVDCGGSCKDVNSCAFGKTCQGDSDCMPNASNHRHCVDGVCCTTSCSGLCQVCDSSGQCGSAKAGYDDPNDTPSCDLTQKSQVCGASPGTCVGKFGAACILGNGGDDCLSNVCILASHTCDHSLLGSPCNSDSDCATGTTCKDYICSI